jgi:hypothetical protein
VAARAGTTKNEKQRGLPDAKRCRGILRKMLLSRRVEERGRDRREGERRQLPARESLYGQRGEVPDEMEPMRFGEAAVRREGDDVTIVGISRMAVTQ